MTSTSSALLSRGESLDLLALKNLGQLIFTRNALNAVAPARYLVEPDRVLVHVFPTSDGIPWRDGDVLTLYVSTVETDERHGWSVAVTGRVHGTPQITNSESQPWINRGGGDLLEIAVELVRGERIGDHEDENATTADDA
jgi:hypothetical protein